MKKYLITTLLLTGFVLCSFLNAQQVQYPSTMYVVAHVLNMRERPKINAPILAKLKKGQKVDLVYKTVYQEQINDDAGHWVKVNAGGKEGYVFDAFLEPAARAYLNKSYLSSGSNYKYWYAISPQDFSKSWFPVNVSLNGVGYSDGGTLSIEQDCQADLLLGSLLPLSKNQAYLSITKNGILEAGELIKLSHVSKDSITYIYGLKSIESNGYQALFMEVFVENPHKKVELLKTLPIIFSDKVLSTESVIIYWHEDINHDDLPDLIFNVNSETQSTQYFMVSKAEKGYQEWSKNPLKFDVCF